MGKNTYSNVHLVDLLSIDHEFLICHVIIENSLENTMYVKTDEGLLRPRSPITSHHQSPVLVLSIIMNSFYHYHHHHHHLILKCIVSLSSLHHCWFYHVSTY